MAAVTEAFGIKCHAIAWLAALNDDYDPDRGQTNALNEHGWMFYSIQDEYECTVNPVSGIPPTAPERIQVSPAGAFAYFTTRDYNSGDYGDDSPAIFRWRATGNVAKVKIGFPSSNVVQMVNVYQECDENGCWLNTYGGALVGQQRSCSEKVSNIDLSDSGPNTLSFTSRFVDEYYGITSSHTATASIFYSISYWQREPISAGSTTIVNSVDFVSQQGQQPFSFQGTSVAPLFNEPYYFPSGNPAQAYSFVAYNSSTFLTNLFGQASGTTGYYLRTIFGQFDNTAEQFFQ